MNAQCPGMNPQNWTPEDIVERACPGCNAVMEFWKDDVKLACPRCGRISFNPNLGDTCLAWCEKAAECIGNKDIEEWKRKIARSKGKG